MRRDLTNEQKAVICDSFAAGYRELDKIDARERQVKKEIADMEKGVSLIRGALNGALDHVTTKRRQASRS